MSWQPQRMISKVLTDEPFAWIKVATRGNGDFTIAKSTPSRCLDREAEEMCGLFVEPTHADLRQVLLPKLCGPGEAGLQRLHIGPIPRRPNVQRRIEPPDTSVPKPANALGKHCRRIGSYDHHGP